MLCQFVKQSQKTVNYKIQNEASEKINCTFAHEIAILVRRKIHWHKLPAFFINFSRIST